MKRTLVLAFLCCHPVWGVESPRETPAVEGGLVEAAGSALQEARKVAAQGAVLAEVRKATVDLEPGRWRPIHYEDFIWHADRDQPYDRSCGLEAERVYARFLTSSGDRYDAACREIKVLSASYRLGGFRWDVDGNLVAGCLGRPLYEVHRLKLLEACRRLLDAGDRISLLTYADLDCRDLADRLRENPIPPTDYRRPSGLLCTDAVHRSGDDDVARLVSRAELLHVVIEAFLGETVEYYEGPYPHPSFRRGYRNLRTGETVTFKVSGREELYQEIRADLTFLPPCDQQGMVAASLGFPAQARFELIAELYRDTLSAAARGASERWYYVLKALEAWAHETRWGTIGDRSGVYTRTIAQGDGWWVLVLRKPVSGG